ncbi:hypothetical protein CDD83_2508 [Cordyceps sp. RAO-2017]|nr:hypothetical protein CDD83_2508 [Cordyceps sp. RAO-2017]
MQESRAATPYRHLGTFKHLSIHASQSHPAFSPWQCTSKPASCPLPFPPILSPTSFDAILLHHHFFTAVSQGTSKETAPPDFVASSRLRRLLQNLSSPMTCTLFNPSWNAEALDLSTLQYRPSPPEPPTLASNLANIHHGPGKAHHGLSRKDTP